MRSFIVLCGRLQALFICSGLLLTLIGAPQATYAEQTLADAEWFERQIGNGVIWRHYQFDNLYGRRQSVSIVEGDLTNPNVSVRFPYLASTRARTSVFVPQQYPDAIAAVNGSYFDTSSGGGGSTTHLRINGTVITPEGGAGMGTAGAVTRGTNNVMRVQQRPSGGWNNYTLRPDVLACGPVLIWLSTIQDFSSFGSHCSGRHPRTAVGRTTTGTGGKIFLVTVDGRTDQAEGMTCDELARLMQELGCVRALNMDGGGSTTMWVAGEPHNGVVNYPSDNSAYDHLGERSCANGVAIIAPPAPPAEWDARLRSVQYTRIMTSGETQTVTLQYDNIGTETWTQTSTTLAVTRPRTRLSDFYTSSSWVTTTTPALLSPANVPPGEVGTFTFEFTAPEVPHGRYFHENFGLLQDEVGPFGPPDNEPYLRIAVEPFDLASSGTIIIESRVGGKNVTRYSEIGGFADVGASCTAPGLTPGIGQRYGSTFVSVAGSKTAVFRPNFSEGGAYNVFVAYGNAGTLARNPITCKVTNASTTVKYLIDQRINANTWVPLGTHVFNAGLDGFVTQSNEDIDVSGSMYVAAVKFEPVAPSEVGDWQLY